MRVLRHIKQLDDCFGDFLVRVVCECGACREIQPQALARSARLWADSLPGGATGYRLVTPASGTVPCHAGLIEALAPLSLPDEK